MLPFIHWKYNEKVIKHPRGTMKKWWYRAKIIDENLVEILMYWCIIQYSTVNYRNMLRTESHTILKSYYCTEKCVRHQQQEARQHISFSTVQDSQKARNDGNTAGLVELVNNLVTVVAPYRECTGMPSSTLAPLSGYPCCPCARLPCKPARRTKMNGHPVGSDGG